jgi:ferredoxin
MAENVFFDELAQSWEEEGLFARDLNGQLIRVVAKTEQDYSRYVTVVIDGQEIQVPRAVPTTDAQGNIVYVDAAGRTVPRATTIFDAAQQLIQRANAARRHADPQSPPLLNPIPTLCHLDHLKPVGVCRVCSVAVETFEVDPRNPSEKKRKRQEKLVPACMQPVEDNMIVHTLESPESRQRGKVEQSVKVLFELLGSDHLPPSPPTRGEQASDLERLFQRYSDRLGARRDRFARPEAPVAPQDDSSPLIHVDHDACILCDRCSRSCGDVKQNFIIGRQGKGYLAQIGFDLGKPMGESNCVECGECMLACPTTALTFRKPVESDWYREQLAQPGRAAVSPAEMEDNELLRTLPWRYRQWNQSSVLRWRVKRGDQLCRLGDYGSTAFVLHSGSYGAWLPRRDASGALAAGWDQGEPTFVCGPDELILGEMTILSQYPRNATVRALADGEVYEIRRNVLFTLQRNPEAREKLDRVYRRRAISNHLNKVPLFAKLSEEDRRKCRDLLLREPNSGGGAGVASVAGAAGGPSGPGGPGVAGARRSIELVHVDPGQMIFRQGERADCFYMIYIGHVKVSQTFGGQERVLTYLRPDQSFGEIACIGDWPEIRDAIPPDQRGPLDNRRAASCAALDDVALVRIDASAFRALLREVPALKAQILEQARAYLADRPSPSAAAAPKTQTSSELQAFTDQGLYNAQRLLVLDLESCTRCDECTKACSDTHSGITRLIRDGLRFDRWLIASSCRSCTDPYCLVGCPVDAIHRLDPHSSRQPIRISAADLGPDSRRTEIQIENNCIGCGLCAKNCPYGNINMHGEERLDASTKRPVVQFRATTCDLCGDIVGNQWRDVSCVYACPHDAAHRVRGDELLTMLRR